MIKRYKWPILTAVILTYISTVSHSYADEISPLDLVKPVTRYKLYVTKGAADLAAGTAEFTAAIKAGDLEKAQQLYAPTRVHYERIEPIAELFSDLDTNIDARADDYEKRESDEAFIGFHRLEYELFEKKRTEGLAAIADKLSADVAELQKRIAGLTIPPEKMAGGAALLIEEIAATKISGEEERYSHTDLWDFKANIDGARKIVELLRPLLMRTDPGLIKKVEANFEIIEAILAKYKTDNGGYQTYDKLTQADRNALQSPITVLAEDLSMLRGALGMN